MHLASNKQLLSAAEKTGGELLPLPKLRSLNSYVDELLRNFLLTASSALLQPPLRRKAVAGAMGFCASRGHRQASSLLAKASPSVPTTPSGVLGQGND